MFPALLPRYPNAISDFPLPVSPGDSVSNTNRSKLAVRQGLEHCLSCVALFIPEQMVVGWSVLIYLSSKGRPPYYEVTLIFGTSRGIETEISVGSMLMVAEPVFNKMLVHGVRSLGCD